MPKLKPHSPGNLSKLTGLPLRTFIGKDRFNYDLVMLLLRISWNKYLNTNLTEEEFSNNLTEEEVKEVEMYVKKEN